jgi:hypothetical protein
VIKHEHPSTTDIIEERETNFCSYTGGPIHPLEIPTIISPLLAHGAAGEFRVQKQDTYQGFLFPPEVPSTRVVACSETADSTKACSRLSPTTMLTLTLICNPTPQEEVQGHE